MPMWNRASVHAAPGSTTQLIYNNAGVPWVCEYDALPPESLTADELGFLMAMGCIA